MASSDIIIRGAREHNLRDVSLVLPRGKLICLTGVSGSGKSSLAFDTLYAEGQRVTSRACRAMPGSSWARCPSPRSTGSTGSARRSRSSKKRGAETRDRRSARSPRSTIICECFLPGSGKGIARIAVGRWLPRPASRSWRGCWRSCRPGRPSSCWRPWSGSQKGRIQRICSPSLVLAPGYVRARASTARWSTCPTTWRPTDFQIKHHIRGGHQTGARPVPIPNSGQRGRLAEAVEQALKLGEGTVIVAAEARPDLLLSSNYSCSNCGLSFDPPSPQLLQLVHRRAGLAARPATDSGIRHDFDPDLLVPNPGGFSVWDGAMRAPPGPIKPVGPGGAQPLSRDSPRTSRPTAMALRRVQCSRAPGATSTRNGGTPGSMAPVIG